MSELKITVVPVGKIDPTEVEGVGSRISKAFTRPVELRAPAPVPRGSEDVGRGQHRAAPFLAELRQGLARLAVAKIVGEGAPSAAPVPGKTTTLLPQANPDALIFITDVDLFTPNTEGVFGEMDARNRCAVISVRRLREAHYRRKADPAKQRARLVKLTLQVIARLKGLADCRNPRCVLAPTGALADIDLKEEKFCGACSRMLATGAFRI